VTLGGSGTAALEATLASLVPREGRLLVLQNGVYGERLTRLAQVHGIPCETIVHGWLEAWDFERLTAALSGGHFTHIAAVHHETTTGRLNAVDVLAGICEQHGVRLLLDTVSSFGAEAIPFHSPALAAWQ
jgi:2-aminoethylphosphonate-pyruvate transaminase